MELEELLAALNDGQTITANSMAATTNQRESGSC